MTLRNWIGSSLAVQCGKNPNLPMQGAQVQSLVGELSFHMLGSTALPSTKEKKRRRRRRRKKGKRKWTGSNRLLGDRGETQRHTSQHSVN